jgi:photosystem II stability/assembly factor-like uncharacterized protein
VFGFACLQSRAVSWFPFGPDGGSARAFAADPRDPNHIYLGAAKGWMYESLDGGKKWQRLARVGMRDDLVIDNILVDPTNAKHLVVGGWVLADGGGIYTSEDGGHTWNSPAEMRGQSVRALAIAPSDPKIYVAGTLQGVFRSADGGSHWDQISPKGSVEIHEIESLAIDPTNPEIIYAGTWHLPWKTKDGGKTWTNMKQGIIEDSDVFSIIVDPKQPSVVYLSACSGIYKSDDAGAKFSKAPGIPSSARRTRVLMQDPNHLDTVYAGTTEGLYRTDDAGKVWTETTGSDLVVNDVYVDPADSRHVLLATDRDGVLASDDGGVSFAPSNTGFSARLITAFTGDAQHAASVYIGVVNDKDAGGVFVSRTGGLSWSQLSDGLGGHDVFSLGQAPDGTIVAGTEHGIYRLKDGVWQRAADDGKAEAIESKAERAQAEKTERPVHGRVVGSHAQVKAARPTVALKNFDGSVSGFAAAGDMLFAASSAGLLQSASSGVAWSVVPSIPADDYRFVSSAKGQIVAASLTKLEASTDDGSRWQAVTLPSKLQQVSALAVDGSGGLWVGDRDGVYFSANNGGSWTPLTNLVVRNINDLYYDAKANRILVTADEPVTDAFAISVPTLRVTTWDTGWNLRFVRPVGDYLVGATMFDGIVVQPRMVDSSLVQKH